MIGEECFNNLQSTPSFKFDLSDTQMSAPDYSLLLKSSFSPELFDALSEASRRKNMAQQAQIDAAEDIAEMKGKMSDVIENQEIQIENQTKQIERQEKTIDQLQDLNECQKLELKRLKEIFVAIENGTAINEETMRNIQKLIEKQPGWKEFIADKGADTVLGGLISILPEILKLLGLKS